MIRPQFGMSRPAQLTALISELRQTVRKLETRIEDEEVRTHIFDRANANYSIAATILRVRRDNLFATISTLEAHSVGDTSARRPSSPENRRRFHD